MAKIEIKGNPSELERFSIFLKKNNIPSQVVDDFGNQSMEDFELSKFDDEVK